MATMEERKILEPIPLGNLFLLEKTHLSEINNNFFDDLNILNLQTTLTMSFATFLESNSIAKDMCINVIKGKLKKETFF
jgi:hypothetical protein